MIEGYRNGPIECGAPRESHVIILEVVDDRQLKKKCNSVRIYLSTFSWGTRLTIATKLLAIEGQLNRSEPTRYVYSFHQTLNDYQGYQSSINYPPLSTFKNKSNHEDAFLPLT